MEIIDGPLASLLLVHLYPIMPCAASHAVYVCVCVILGLYRLHSLSWVHSHRVCGLPGKQEDPPPQMVQLSQLSCNCVFHCPLSSGLDINHYTALCPFMLNKTDQCTINFSSTSNSSSTSLSEVK